MISLLLLDLDGVVVFEIGPPQAKKVELIKLHSLLDEILRDIGIPVVILTHRSKAEAAMILRLVGLSGSEIAGVMAAEDIFKAALRRPRLLLRGGLKKSWALAKVEKRYGVPRQQIAFIDNDRHNVDDLFANGIGLAILAPSGMTEDGNLISFDFGESVRLLKASGDGLPNLITLPSKHINIERCSRTGVVRPWLSPFNAGRRFGRFIRIMARQA